MHACFIRPGPPYLIMSLGKKDTDITPSHSDQKPRKNSHAEGAFATIRGQATGTFATALFAFVGFGDGATRGRFLLDGLSSGEIAVVAVFLGLES